MRFNISKLENKLETSKTMNEAVKARVNQWRHLFNCAKDEDISAS